MIKKLDTIFSKFIRLRDTDEYGYGKCFICGETFHYDELECGHFRSRRNLGTRWYSDNAHAQCHECNTRDDAAEQMIAMVHTEYGMDNAAEIIRLSKGIAKFTKEDYKEMYKFLQAKAKELLKDKMFKVNL